MDGEVEAHGSSTSSSFMGLMTDMLGKIIKKLTVSRGNDHITSGIVLTWAKRVEAQRVQAAVMNSIRESKEFDKIKVSRSLHKEK